MILNTVCNIPGDSCIIDLILILLKKSSLQGKFIVMSNIGMCYRINHCILKKTSNVRSGGSVLTKAIVEVKPHLWTVLLRPM